jgi:hypothetical protein
MWQGSRGRRPQELQPGVSVEVHGLVKRPELNGKIGVVQRGEGDRLVVAFDDGTDRALRPELRMVAVSVLTVSRFIVLSFCSVTVLTALPF